MRRKFTYRNFLPVSHMRATYSFSRNFENCLSKENRDAPCLLLFLYFFSVLGSFYAVLNPFSAKFSSKPSFYYVARRCHLHASKILTGCPYGMVRFVRFSLVETRIHTFAELYLYNFLFSYIGRTWYITDKSLPTNLIYIYRETKRNKYRRDNFTASVLMP